MYNILLSTWCKNKGIFQDFRTPYTPQLNGKAERMKRTLIEKARAIILDSNFNKKMWEEAITMAAYLNNKSSSNVIEKTPYANWFKRKPDLINIQIFGTNGYAKVKTQIRMLDNRSNKYKFI